MCQAFEKFHCVSALLSNGSFPGELPQVLVCGHGGPFHFLGQLEEQKSEGGGLE